MAYTTVDNVKTYLGITGTADDTLIGSLIGAAQAHIDRLTGRTFEAPVPALTSLMIDPAEYVRGNDLYFPRDACAFWIGSPPLNYYIATVSGNALPITDAFALPHHEAYHPPYYGLRILSRASVSWYDLVYDPGRDDNIYLSAVWAYSMTPPSDIAHACVRLAGYYYRLKDAQTYDVTAYPESGELLLPKGVPQDVRLMLEPYIRRL